jgi:hypothetical protein
MKNDPLFASLPTVPTRQFALNVLVPITPGRAGSLRGLLGRIGRETIAEMKGAFAPGALIAFDRIVSLHYARWVIFEDSKGAELLAWSVHFDGPVGVPCGKSEATRRHFEEWAAVARPALDAIYAHCEGYPGPTASAEEVVAYWTNPARATAPSAFYCGGRGRSRDQIRAEAKLRACAAAWVDDAMRSGTLRTTAEGVRTQLVDALGLVPSFPAQPDNRPFLWIAAVAAVALLVVAFAVSKILFAALCLLAALPVGVLLVKELMDPEFEPEYTPAERRHVAESAVDEDIFLQNALSNVVAVKPGWFRGVLLRIVLWAIDFLARTLFVRGALGSLTSIHFGHWYFVDGGRRLAFVSNFDNSWESYLGDFIDQASNGLTAVWSNTVGYPRTRLLFWAGSRAGDRFKAWARHWQIPTPVWYSAYPSLSIVNINDNTEIRRGLADPGAVPAAVWLAKLT